MVPMLFLTWAAVAEVTIQGKVIDAQTKEDLVGVTVMIDGTTTGTATSYDGSFSINTSQSGPATLVMSFVGYKETPMAVTLPSSGSLNVGTVALEPDVMMLRGAVVTAAVAVRRKTPVAVSVINQDLIEFKMSNQEFPELLRSTPGIYATTDGGGYGDSRVNLRGFESENIAVMVNGIPMNDMEWGGVYWSNWAGLTDVTRTTQVQRGLGASKVAAPSIGGSINIVTRTTDQEKGGSVSYRMGNDGYNKIGFNVSTGLSENGWAITLLGAKEWGSRPVMGTEYEAYTWFASITKVINSKHELSLTGFGNNQWHNQRYNGDKLLITEWEKQPDKYYFNPTYGFGADGERIVPNRNRYHKPQISLNHSWQINEYSNLSTVLYLSLGFGGGRAWRGSSTSDIYGTNTSTGLLNTKYRNPLTGYMDFGILQRENAASDTGSVLALTESINNHVWTGLISTYTTRFGEYLDFSGGVDVRYYQGLHDAEIIDLVGGQFFIDPYRKNVTDPTKNTGDAFINEKLKVGDNVYRDNTGYVFQGGVFGQLEYNREPWSVFVSGAVSNHTYWKKDRFYYGKDNQKSDVGNFIGWNVKGGANYNINSQHNVFFNTGYMSRAPFMSGGYFNRIHTSNSVNEEAVNEKSFSFELGYGFRSRFFTANFNAYYTKWMDKTQVQSYGTNYDAFVNLSGVDARHMGLELEFTVSVTPKLDIQGMVSLGDWMWDSEASGYIFTAGGQPTNNGNDVVSEADHKSLTLDLRDVKVGNSAQTSFYISANYKFDGGFRLSADYTHYADNYANYSIDTPNAGTTYKYYTPWKIPDYGLLDVNGSYTFNIGNFNATLTANVKNILDQVYISDAKDLNPRVEGTHHWTSASVMYGFGRTYTIGLKVRF